MLSNRIIYISNSDFTTDQLKQLLGDKYKYIDTYFSVCDAIHILEKTTPPLVIIAHEFAEDSIEDFNTLQQSHSEHKISPLLLCDEFDHEEGMAEVNTKVFSDLIVIRPLIEESKLLSLFDKAIAICKERTNQEKENPVEAPHSYILAIEDDDFVAEIYQTTLSALDEDVIISADCNSAFDLIYEITPMLIFLDYNLPDFDGLEFLRTIGSDPSMKNIPIIVVSGENEPELQEKCLALGAYKFIKKPMKSAEIIALVNYFKNKN